MPSTRPPRPTTAAFAWARPFFWREAVLCVAAMPALLLAGRALGQEVAGIVAAGAAFSVGFGASRGLHGQRWGAMLAATLGIALAAYVGSLTGRHPLALLPLIGLGAAACAVLGFLDDDLWWVTLQVSIALIVSGFFAGPTSAAAERALVTLLGGATQLACVVVLAQVFKRARAPLPHAPPKPPAPRRALVAQAVRAAVAVMLSAELARRLGLANSYWAPMTALLVLKPGLHDTRTRGVERVLGTLAGCAVATLFVVVVRAEPFALIAGLALTAGAAFALQKANYASMTGAVTATIVLLNSLVAGHVVANAEHRLLDTLLGGLVALAVAAVVPHQAPSAGPPTDTA